MARIQCNFQSDALGSAATIEVILPEPLRKSYPVLYLLHGLLDDQTTWTRQTSIERYVQDMGVAVVMPAVQRGFYTDMAAGPRYFSFVADELVVTDTLPLREDAKACSRIRQISVASLLADTMLRISNEESVSSLFME